MAVGMNVIHHVIHDTPFGWFGRTSEKWDNTVVGCVMPFGWIDWFTDGWSPCGDVHSGRARARVGVFAVDRVLGYAMRDRD